jgi:23S rRNA (uracil1939-C5)-methyltransferase
MSQNEQKPELCPHFGECGGCRHQDIPYADQLARKEQVLHALFGVWWDKPIAVAPSPAVWHYRNRVELAFGPKHYPEPPPPGFVRETVFGFKRRARWYWTLDVQECRITSVELSGLLEAVRAWFRRENLAAYNSRTGEGNLRFLLVREGKRTGERMVVLIARDTQFDKAAFVKAVLSKYPATSVFVARYGGRSEVASAEEMELVHGNPVIEECLHVPDEAGSRVVRFRISPFSFFQTSTLGAEQLYGMVREWVRHAKPPRLYDLYGGSGGIALVCNDLVPEVVSVERETSASQDGRHNAALNGAHNITFVTRSMEDFLSELRACPGGRTEGPVVVDPPRAGLHPKVVEALLALPFPEILYISCKPSVLAHELGRLSEGYSLEGVKAIDLFPHTEHVEVLARLVRRGSGLRAT